MMSRDALYRNPADLRELPYIEADTFNITINDVTEFIGIICSLDDGIILVFSICKAKAGCRFYHINNLLLEKMPRYWGKAMRNWPRSLFT